MYVVEGSLLIAKTLSKVRVALKFESKPAPLLTVSDSGDQTEAVVTVSSDRPPQTQSVAKPMMWSERMGFLLRHHQKAPHFKHDDADMRGYQPQLLYAAERYCLGGKTAFKRRRNKRRNDNAYRTYSGAAQHRGDGGLGAATGCIARDWNYSTHTPHQKPVPARHGVSNRGMRSSESIGLEPKPLPRLGNPIKQSYATDRALSAQQPERTRRHARLTGVGISRLKAGS